MTLIFLFTFNLELFILYFFINAIVSDIYCSVRTIYNI